MTLGGGFELSRVSSQWCNSSHFGGLADTVLKGRAEEGAKAGQLAVTSHSATLIGWALGNVHTQPDEMRPDGLGWLARESASEAIDINFLSRLFASGLLRVSGGFQSSLDAMTNCKWRLWRIERLCSFMGSLLFLSWLSSSLLRMSSTWRNEK